MGVVILDYVASLPSTLYSNIDDILLALIICFIVVFICDFLREVLLFNSSVYTNEFYWLLAAEFIGTVEACVFAFEISTILYALFGVLIFGIATFIHAFWQLRRTSSYQYDGETLPVVLKFIKTWNSGYSIYSRTHFILFVIITQISGAFLAYHVAVNGAWRMAKHWTWWKKSNFHYMRFTTAFEWESAITVGAIVAGLLEGFLTFSLYLIIVLIRKQPYEKFNNFKISLGKAVLLSMGVPFSGGFCSPLQATAVEITTVGHSWAALVLVYWIAPFTGAFLGMAAERILFKSNLD